MAAKKKTIEEKSVQAPSAGIQVEKLSYPPERSAGRIVGQGADAVPELLRLLREEAKVL
jgi:electron transfer flavoprotein beta subunit